MVTLSMRSSSLRHEVDAVRGAAAEQRRSVGRGARSGGAVLTLTKVLLSARALATALNDTIAFQNQKSVGSRSSYSQPLSRSSYSQPLPRSPTCIPNPNFDPNCDPHP